MRTWWIIVAGLAAFGAIGGIQSGAPASEWGWFVAGVLIIGFVGTGIISTVRGRPEK